MSSIPVLQTPQAIVVNVRKKAPTRNILRPPTTSVIEPQMRRVQPHAREFTEAGQSSRALESSRSRAMVGRQTTSIPANMLLTRVMQATLLTMAIVLHLERDEALTFFRDGEEGLASSRR
jgi:hypothetical protein